MNKASLQDLLSMQPDEPTFVEIHAQIIQNQKKTTRNNKPYLDIVLADATQTLSLKIWEDKPWYANLSRMLPRTFVSVTATWSKNAYGVEASELSVRQLTPDEVEALFLGNAELKETQNKEWASILSLIASMKDPRIKALCELFCTKYEARLRRTAAARTYHHARRGGIIEHVGGMMRCADALCSVYPQLNRDLLLAGCLFHDSGKLWENIYAEKDFDMPYTEIGELMGHIPCGIELVNKLWTEIQPTLDTDHLTWDPPSSQVRLHLLHMIASHHGELAFGSPVPPKTPEAAALHYIDNLDAKLEMFRNAYASSEQIGQRVFQRKPPLPANEVLPLPPFSAES